MEIERARIVLSVRQDDQRGRSRGIRGGCLLYAFGDRLVKRRPTPVSRGGQAIAKRVFVGGEPRERDDSRHMVAERNEPHAVAARERLEKRRDGAPYVARLGFA